MDIIHKSVIILYFYDYIFKLMQWVSKNIIPEIYFYRPELLGILNYLYLCYIFFKEKKTLSISCRYGICMIEKNWKNKFYCKRFRKVIDFNSKATDSILSLIPSKLHS